MFTFNLHTHVHTVHVSLSAHTDTHTTHSFTYTLHTQGSSNDTTETGLLKSHRAENCPDFQLSLVQLNTNSLCKVEEQ